MAIVLRDICIVVAVSGLVESRVLPTRSNTKAGPESSAAVGPPPISWAKRSV